MAPFKIIRVRKDILYAIMRRFIRKDGHIKRPRNSWLIYREENMDTASGTFGAVSQALGKKWRNLAGGRSVYAAKAAVESFLHKFVFTGYKYSPAKKGKGKRHLSRRRRSNTHRAALTSGEKAQSPRVCPPQAPPRATHHPTTDQHPVAPVPIRRHKHAADSYLLLDSPQVAGARSYGASLPFGAGNQCGTLDAQFGPIPRMISPSATNINTMRTFAMPYNLFDAGPPPQKHRYLPYSPPPYEPPQYQVATNVFSSHSHPQNHLDSIQTFSPPPLNAFLPTDCWGPIGMSATCPSIHLGENHRLSTGPPTGPFTDVEFGGGFSTQGFDPLSLRGSRRKREVEPHTTMTSWPTSSFAIENSGGPCFDFGFDGFV